jgi:hypothetical protein
MRLYLAALSDGLWLRARRGGGLAHGGLVSDAWRAVRRKPGFTLAVIATLALGMGGVTTVFTVLDAALLRPMPYAGVERLIEVARSLPGGYLRMEVEWDVYEVWSAQTSVFEAMEARRERSVVVRGVGEPATARAAWFTAGVIDMLGVVPVRGRTFTAREMDVGGVALVSENWLRPESAHGSGMLGATVWIDDVPHEVIGIMPDDFRYPDRRTAIFLPMTERTSPVVPLGRLRAGVDAGNAAEVIGPVADRLQSERPREDGWGLYPRPVANRQLPPQSKRALMLLLGGT